MLTDVGVHFFVHIFVFDKKLRQIYVRYKNQFLYLEYIFFFVFRNRSQNQAVHFFSILENLAHSFYYLF